MNEVLYLIQNINEDQITNCVIVFLVFGLCLTVFNYLFWLTEEFDVGMVVFDIFVLCLVCEKFLQILSCVT